MDRWKTCECQYAQHRLEILLWTPPIDLCIEKRANRVRNVIPVLWRSTGPSLNVQVITGLG